MSTAFDIVKEERANVRVIEEIVSTIQNEFCNRSGDWEFDGRRVVNAYRKGKNKLILELGDDAEITLRLKPNGAKKECPSCGSTKSGWPFWWKNIAFGGLLLYACHDCVVRAGGGEGEGEADRPEEDVDRH
jgi:hypothetical protein